MHHQFAKLEHAQGGKTVEFPVRLNFDNGLPYTGKVLFRHQFFCDMRECYAEVTTEFLLEREIDED